ncbi:glutathione binding-like protein [Pseudomonas arcuscaelestis]|uniref:glutathione binding-like protein n=1 Tax=Pseudomonas arcuscaelestis TaxID=2710591 RepID=UPI001F300840|nr:glutathione binding-like protein [Pseudomonas arcuscaelestis]
MADVPRLEHGADSWSTGAFRAVRTPPIQAAIERYRDLTQQTFTTLDNQLAHNRWLAGPEYSIADIATFGWMHIARIIDFDFSRFNHLKAWYERMELRPAVQRGISLPQPATGP